MADKDNFVIDIFSNEDEFGLETHPTRKVTTREGSGLMMVSGYGSDESESVESMKIPDNIKRTVYQDENLVDKTVVPMDLEELEEGECFSDLDPEEELERLFDTKQNKNKVIEAIEESNNATVEENVASKNKKKEKKRKKKKKKQKDNEKKTERGKGEKHGEGRSRSESKERRHQRKDSIDEESGHSRRSRDEHRGHKSNLDSYMKSKDGEKHSSRDKNKTSKHEESSSRKYTHENKQWPKHHSELDYHSGETRDHREKKRHTSRESKHKKEKRIFTQRSPSSEWERRVKVVDRNSNRGNDHQVEKKLRHKLESITIAIDQKTSGERTKSKKVKDYQSEYKTHDHRRRQDSDDSSASESEGESSLNITDSKKEKRKGRLHRSKERHGREAQKEEIQVKKRDGSDKLRGRNTLREKSELREHKTKHKNRKSTSKSAERKKEKKKKKKKKKDGDKERQRTTSRSSKHSVELNGDKRYSTSLDMAVEKQEGSKDLDLEMQKDREYNTLDQRLQEIERRLALDTDISSDDDGFLNKHLPDNLNERDKDEQEDSEIHGLENRNDNLYEREYHALDDGCENQFLKLEGDTPLQSTLMDDDEEELSGEALFMKEYGLELEEKSDNEMPTPVTETATSTGAEKFDILPQSEGISFSLKKGILEQKGSSLPGFDRDVAFERLPNSNKGILDTRLESAAKESAKWKPFGGVEEVEEISDDDNNVAFDAVEESVTNVAVSSDRIYQENISEDNDEQSQVWDTKEQEVNKESDIYNPTSNLEEISDQEDIFDSIEREEELSKNLQYDLDMAVESSQKDDALKIERDDEEIQSSKWKPLGVTQVQAVSQKLLLTPSDEYCDFKEIEKSNKHSDQKEKSHSKSSRKKTEEKHTHRHKRDKTDREHKRHNSKERDSKASGQKEHIHDDKHHHYHNSENKGDHHHSVNDNSISLDPGLQKQLGSVGESTHKVERTADKYRKKPAKKTTEKIIETDSAKEEKFTDRRRRSRSKDKGISTESKHRSQKFEAKEVESEQNDVEHEITIERTKEVDVSVGQKIEDKTLEADNSFYDDQESFGTKDNTDTDKGQAAHDIQSVPKDLSPGDTTMDSKEMHSPDLKNKLTTDIEKEMSETKEKNKKRHKSKEVEVQDASHSGDDAMEKNETVARKKKKRRDSGRKTKDDLFDDIFGNDDVVEEEKDDLANLLKDPEPFKKNTTDFSPSKINEKDRKKDKSQRKKSEEPKQRKKEQRRKRDSETAGEIGGKFLKLDSKTEPEKIPGIMDEEIVTKDDNKETAENGHEKTIPLLFDTLPKIDVLRGNSEEKENDRSSFVRGPNESGGEQNLTSDENFEDLSPYNPEELTPMYLSDSQEGVIGLQSDSIALAIESIEKKRETILANLNFETILREKAREHARQRKANSKGGSIHEKLSNDPRESKEGMIDYLIRQSRVEDEMKSVLKDYYRKREISKDEYKTILKKAVPQVTMSNSPIIPEKIRSLMKKFVCKTKGQRILFEQKQNNQPVKSKKKGFYKNFKPPKLPEPKPKEKKDVVRSSKSSSNMSNVGFGTQLKILNPNLPMPPVL